METLLRIQTLLICLLLLGFAYAATSKKALFGNLVNSRVVRIYHWFIFSTTIMLVTDLLAWVLDGRPGKGIHTLLLVNYTIYYAFHTLPTVCFILYATLMPEHKRLKCGAFPFCSGSVFVILALAFKSTGWLSLSIHRMLYARDRYS